jgi:hypothetical protein
MTFAGHIRMATGYFTHTDLQDYGGKVDETEIDLTNK